MDLKQALCLALDKMARVKRFFIGALLALALSGCGPSPSKESVEEAVAKSYARSLIKRQEDLQIPTEQRATVVDITLVRKSGHEYTGFVQLSDGDKVNLEVTVDDDGEIVWRS
jgi:hypothetical protein